MSLRSLFLAALRAAFCLVAFVAGMAVVSTLIHDGLPFPDVPLVRAKAEHFVVHHDEYDTLFVGSSRMYYQIIPTLFDKLAAEQGQPVKSFNSGIAGMRPPEDAYYLDYLLRTPPKNLRWVFIELAGLRTSVDRDKIGTVRAVYWHDLPRMWMLLKRAFYLKEDPKKRKFMRNVETRLEPFLDYWDHIRLFVENQSNLGRASLLTAKLISDKPLRYKPPASVLGDNLAGWIRTGRPETMVGPELEAYEKALAARRTEPAVHDPIDPISQQALERMITRVEKLGAKVVLIVPPTTSRRNFFPDSERAKKTIVLDFCDLQKYPELYENRYRLDTDHLNADGAEVFTHVLVKEWMQAQQQNP